MTHEESAPEVGIGWTSTLMSLTEFPSDGATLEQLVERGSAVAREVQEHLKYMMYMGLIERVGGERFRLTASGRETATIGQRG